MKTTLPTKKSALRILWAVLLYPASVPFLFAQLSSYIPLTSGGIEQPTALAVGDLDGDGNPDVVSASDGDHRIAWYRNDGAGRFSQQLTLTTEAHGAIDVETGDLNGDGSLDIAAVASLDSNLVVFLNNGAGGFETVQAVHLAVLKPRGVELVDLDQDEDLDIVWFSDAADSIGWLANDGAGTFTPAGGIGSDVNGLFTIQVADLDGDEDLDVLCSLPNYDQVGWLPNLGNGQFGALIWLEGEIPAVKYILATDLTGDGLPEVLAASQEDNDLFLLPNLGGGQFGGAVLISNIIWGNAPFQAADLDLDGDRDILIADPDGNLDWFLNDGQGDFSVMEEITATTSGLQGLKIADIDQDGRPDIITFAYWDLIEWLPNKEEDPFSLALGITRLSHNPKKITHADLNQDGHTDLLLEADQKMAWFPGDGNGAFGSPRRFYKNQYDGAGMLQAGDLNGDGLADMVAGRLYGGGPSDQIRWKANNGGGDFSGFDHTIISNMGISGLSDIDLGDLNGDGVDDVAYAAYNSPGGPEVVGWFENNGAGQFSSDVHLGAGTGVNTLVACVDLDGDGLTDILACGGYVGLMPPSIFWFRNLGGGAFASSPASLSPVTEIDEVLLVDLDRDGDIDIVYAQEDNGDINWLENQGPAFFQAPQLLATGPSDITGLHAADLNEDGYPEIISWSWANDASGYYENLTGRAAISGFCFHDGNQNGVFDADERPLRGVPVLLEPAGLVAYSDAAGRYRFNVPPGDYTLEASNHYCWERIVDSTYILTLAEEPIQGPDIGYAAGNSQAGLIATVAMAPLRCTEIVPAWVLVENPNCTAAPGMVEVVLDDLLTFVSATPLPEAIAGDTLIWDLDSIPAAQSRSIYLEVQAADANYAGEITNISAQINPLIGPGDPLVSKLYVAVDTIRCSYDPNDKLVNLRYVPIDYLPVEHELVYTLRFQNTGNDTAFSVRLRDTLSANLNWPTLRPLGSSHAYYTVFDTETGLLEFVFDNILLPDSTADERGSHGFVQFAVQLLAGLPPGTVVPNGAGIYFDANPVVLTNTVETQVVDPVSTHAPQEPRALNVYPNPGSGYFRVRFDRPANGQLSVRDAMGRLLLSRKIPAGTAEASIGLSGYPGGIYWILWSEEGMKPAAARIILQ